MVFGDCPEAADELKGVRLLVRHFALDGEQEIEAAKKDLASKGMKF
jgi:hypothetical protein